VAKDLSRQERDALKSQRHSEYLIRRQNSKMERLIAKQQDFLDVMAARRKGEKYWAFFWRCCKRDKFLILLALPGILNFLIWHYGPIYGMVIAFKDYSMKKGILGSPWAADFGLKHIINFLNYPNLDRILWNTVSLNLLFILFVPLPGVVFALFLNEMKFMPVKRVVQSVSYFPHFLSSVIVVGIFTLMLSPSTGMVNNLIVALGGIPIYFMMSATWFRPIMVIMAIWQSIGWDTIIWLARIATIDLGQYEAAAIEGASRWQRMRYITLPAFKEWYVIGLIIGFGGILNSCAQDKIYLMWNASIAPTAETIGMYIFRRGLLFADYSYGAAVGFAFSMVALLLILIFNKIAKLVSNTSLFG